MRRTVALLLLLLAVPLLAFPIAAPATDPPDRLTHRVEPYDRSPDRVDRAKVLAYENFSDRGQTYFDAALDQPQGEAHTVLDDVGAEAFPYDVSAVQLVEKDGSYYTLRADRDRRLPDGLAVLLRIASLAVGVVAAALGGYWRLNADA